MEADSFLLFYIRHRIEEGEDGLQWFEAPHCGEDEDRPVPDNWLAVEQAALHFERDNKKDIERELIDNLTRQSAFNFVTFKHFVDAYFVFLQKRFNSASANLCVPFLALIAFIGLFARRLAEMDASGRSPVSIYGSTLLRSQLDKFAAAHGGGNAYSWDRLCTDSRRLLERISSTEEREALVPFPSTSSCLGVVLCGIAATIAYFLIVRRAAVSLT